MPAGYSGTPLPKKLGIKPGHRVVLIDTPADFEAELVPLPEGVRLRASPEGEPADVILAFFMASVSLSRSFIPLARSITPAGGLWIAWPKKASGVVSDLTDNVVRDIGLKAGLVDNKGCAVTEVWSGLRFVYRLQDRPR